jgi:hypothetical protein
LTPEEQTFLIHSTKEMGFYSIDNGEPLKVFEEKKIIIRSVFC